MSFELAPKGKKCPFFGGKLEVEKNTDGNLTAVKNVPCDCRDNVIDGTCQDTWLHIQGTHPLTGEAINKWECAFRATWFFAAEAAKNSHHGHEATLTLRNMIFDSAVRERELAKSAELKTIEAPK